MRLLTTQSFAIRIEDLNKQRFFEESSRSGPYEVRYALGGAEFTITLERSLETGDKWMRIKSISSTGWKEPKMLNQLVAIDFTPCHFGGIRWWFICTQSRNGQKCRKRVAVLYLPTEGELLRGFGCRCCHKLRYPVGNTVRERDRALMREIRKTVLHEFLIRRHCKDCGMSLAAFEGVKEITVRSKRCPVCQKARD
jgi:hypothetical protein